MNIHGQHGIINSTGKPGANAEILDCRNKGFLYNVEDGIRSTVVAILSKGLLTLSSCQGHEESCPYRCVSIVNDISVIRFLQKIVHELNTINKYGKPITYYLLPYQERCGVYLNEFVSPAVIDISFGDYRDSDTLLKQLAFEEYLIKNTIDRLDTDLPSKYVLPYLRSGEHIDVFSNNDIG